MPNAESSRKPSILIGVTGSVDAMLVPAYIRAIRAGLECSISVILTPDAMNFVNVDSLSLIVERVICGESPKDWSTDRPGLIAAGHDLMIVLPATANTLSAAAAGTSMNRLTMMFLVGNFPIVFFPVMGPAMWDRPVVQRNVAMIREDGHEIIEPAWKDQYEPHYQRMYGHYTLPEPEDVLAVIRRKLDAEAVRIEAAQ
ncbi:flavoprotein [Paracoccus onubensis]|uniref:Flavoprotein n=1 Tax=Paracoccus onubensis TaxID=1675788 RepID=A0A418T7U1_9RHOB|nr:flavoprotein [Paracoccus onubensis]RJE89294.1 flavoprotein [Paracoccus onubensis]